jgi:hypothetical protein
MLVLVLLVVGCGYENQSFNVTNETAVTVQITIIQPDGEEVDIGRPIPPGGSETNGWDDALAKLCSAGVVVARDVESGKEVGRFKLPMSSHFGCVPWRIRESAAPSS